MRLLTALALAILLGSACGAGAAGPLPPSRSPGPSDGAVLVTRANDGGVVQARVGDRVRIALGTEFDWRLDPPDGIVLARSPQDEPLVRGTHAVWNAVSAGSANVTATGTVICPSGKACIQIAVLFRTTVIVGP